jgi:hypothetical protein
MPEFTHKDAFMRDLIQAAYISADDFYQKGARGLTLEQERSENIDPCDGCDNRTKCSEQFLACARYKFYMQANEAFVNPDRYMQKSNQPSRAIYKSLFGGDNLPPLKQKPSDVPKSVILEAISQTKETRYPADGYLHRNEYGTRTEWEAVKQRNLETLRQKLVEA